MESQFSSGGGATNSGNAHANRFTALDNFAGQSNYYDSTSGPGGVHPNKPNSVTVNLEDAVLEEQKLYQILEVSPPLIYSFYRDLKQAFQFLTFFCLCVEFAK